MEFLVIGVLVVIVLAFVAYPLFVAPSDEAPRKARARTPAKSTGAQTPQDDSPSVSADSLEVLLAQRNALYDAIRDLDFDFQLGKLSQSDYQSLRDQYKARAATMLQQIDAATARVGSDGAGAAIEQEVARLRQRKTAEPDAIEQEVAQLRHKPAGGDAVEQEVARLRGQRKAGTKGYCPKCGHPYVSGDRFCAKCGNKL